MRGKMAAWLHRLSTSGRLRTKLLVVYFLLIVIPLGLFSVYTYRKVRRVMQQQTLTAAQNAFDDTRLSLSRTLGQLDDVLEILANDPLVYQASSNDPADYTYLRRLEDSYQLGTTFDHLRTLSGVDRIRLYVDNDYPYSRDLSTVMRMETVAGTAWYRQVMERGETWCAPADYADQPAGEQGWVSSLRIIYNPSNVREPMAILRVDVESERIAALLSGTSITENGLLLLLRGDEVLLASDPTLSADAGRTLADGLPAGESGWQLTERNGSRCFIQSRDVGGGWRLASVLPYSDVFRLSDELNAELLAVVVVLAAIAYLLAYLISQSTLNRLSLLTRTMHTVEQGDVAVRLPPDGNDEIAQLMGSFTRMMDRIDALMEEKVAYGQQIKNLELKALQAQINPHFLYNSLDLINCTAINRNVPEISRMVNALSRFYRISLSRGRDTIPLEEEIRHARLYVQIQNMRFDNRVEDVWEIDPAVRDCPIIKIVLQPLIENAIIHGIFEKESKTGVLTVTARKAGGDVVITIRDDGVGMTEAVRRANFDPGGPLAETAGGYGVRNVADRLRLAYGEGYGLECVSTPGAGTVVTVRIPAVPAGPK